MSSIHPAYHAWALQQTGVSAMIMGGRLYQGYIQIAAAALTADVQLRGCLARALTYNASLPAK